MPTRVALVRSAGLVLLAALAACSGGSPGSPSIASSSAGPTTGASGSASALASVASASPSAAVDSRSAIPSPSPALPGEPPIATLDGLGTGPVAGDLGTVSWAGTTSDAPWIVGPTRSGAAAGARLTVIFDPPTAPTTWRARWAPVEGHEAGQPRAGGSGTGRTIALTAPRTPGDWTLEVEAGFGPDHSGVWYWRVQVGA